MDPKVYGTLNVKPYLDGLVGLRGSPALRWVLIFKGGKSS